MIALKNIFFILQALFLLVLVVVCIVSIFQSSAFKKQQSLVYNQEYWIRQSILKAEEQSGRTGYNATAKATQIAITLDPTQKENTLSRIQKAGSE